MQTGHHLGDGLDSILGADAHDLVGAQPAPNADPHRELLFAVVDDIEQLPGLFLREPHLLAVLVGVVCEVHVPLCLRPGQ